MRSSATITLWLCCSQLSLAGPGLSLETVQTENGLITGHRSSKVNDVWEYLGIPYAQPPLGDLRFAAPQKYNTTEPYNATSFVSICLVSRSC